MPIDKLLTYKDLLNRFQVSTVRTVARILNGCPRFKPTRGTVRFREVDVETFIEKRTASAGRRPDGVRRTKRPVSD
jgi:hypothetical protein